MKTKQFAILYSTLLSLVILCFTPRTSASYYATIDANDPRKEHYSFSYEKGTPIADHIIITNTSDAESTSVKLYSIDGLTNVLGQLVFKTADMPQVAIGEWVTFSESSVNLGPKETKEVTFNVNVPDNAVPGTYIGGLAVERVNITPAVKSTAAFAAVVKSRTIKQMFVKVPGTVVSKGTVKDFQFSNEILNRNFTFTLNNEGNTLIQGEGKITIDGGFYKMTPIELPIKISSIQGGTTSQNKIPFPANFQNYGNFHATLNIQLKEFDPFKNTYTDLTSYKLDTNFQLIPWNIIWIIITIIISLLALILLLIVLFIVKKKLLLKSCEPYTVKEGDTINSISQARNMSWQKLAKINKLHAPYELKVNDQLLVKKLPTNEQTK